ncbi:hypothetical protein RirG_085300 [Rhizophagus irregularis DAOM 197198w]|uniref:Protein kinase domain-containing protein n=1 Tax=Rhizophagus irregularis (strain DAOM 197198w) TaxID=1432141 RepID=A0A015MV98_RHIIW|nr:hypothetical protein RirG_085300 [Rhizophagus irregularis DAOM 197198w]
MQLEIYNYNDIIVEWISYDQFNDIKELGKDELTTTIYSAIWKDGSLNYDENKYEYIRNQNIKVNLKSFHNSQNITNELLIEIKTYFNGENLFGISQNLETKDYILVLQNIYCDKYVEWIPYDQFNNIKELEKDEFTTIYSAIWKDGPLNYIMEYYDYTRKQNKKVNLKCLHNSQNINNEFLIEFNRYSTRFYSYNKFKIFGISQNPDIKDYILVLQNVYCDKCDKCFTDKYGIWCKSCQINDIEKNITNWTSGNEKIDNLIQEMRLKINNPYDIVFEWIPYDQFYDIKELGEDEFATIYSAIWKDNPLQY